MNTRRVSFGFAFRTSGMLLLASSLACNGSSLKQPSDAGSGGPGGSSGGAGAGGVHSSGGSLGSGGLPGSGGSGGTAASGGTKSAGGAPGSGGTPSTGGKSGSGGGSGSGGTGYGGAGPGSGGVTGSGGGPGSGGTTGTAGKTGSDGGADASVDAFREAFRNDAALTDGADTAMVTTSDASDTGTDTRGIDALSPGAQEYVKTYLEPYCARLSECCAQAGLPYSGLGACEAYELGFVKYLNDGSSVIVPSVIQTLLDQMKTSCDHPSYALIGAATDGTRTSGQPCVAPDQCAGTPALCLSAGTTASGTCMTPPRGKAGDGCAVTCDDTTVCKWGISSGKSPYSVCYDQDKLRCDSTTNTCVAVTAVGKACTDYSECGAHAECSNATCRAFAQVGQDCGGVQGCDRNLQCIANSSGTKSTCQTLSMAWSGSCSP